MVLNIKNKDNNNKTELLSDMGSLGQSLVETCSSCPTVFLIMSWLKCVMKNIYVLLLSFYYYYLQWAGLSNWFWFSFIPVRQNEGQSNCLTLTVTNSLSCLGRDLIGLPRGQRLLNMCNDANRMMLHCILHDRGKNSTVRNEVTITVNRTVSWKSKTGEKNELGVM